jgi:hypothetical protein
MLLPKVKRPRTNGGISQEELQAFETRLSETLKQIDSLAAYRWISKRSRPSWVISVVQDIANAKASQPNGK